MERERGRKQIKQAAHGDGPRVHFFVPCRAVYLLNLQKVLAKLHLISFFCFIAVSFSLSLSRSSFAIRRSPLDIKLSIRSLRILLFPFLFVSGLSVSLCIEESNRLSEMQCFNVHRSLARQTRGGRNATSTIESSLLGDQCLMRFAA